MVYFANTCQALSTAKKMGLQYVGSGTIHQTKEESPELTCIRAR